VIRRIVAVVVVLACACGVIAYQATRPGRAPANPRAFVPSPRFFLDFSPSFRTSIADAYYLNMVQYYGENHKSAALESIPAMVDLVTTLSPHFKRAYGFGAFALADAGRPDLSIKVLEKGFAANPDDYAFPAYLGYFAYQYGTGSKQQNDAAGSRWYQRAAAIPGSPPYLLRLAAVLAGKGGEEEKAVVMWGQVYAAGDKYSRQKAVDGLDRILPKDKAARKKAVAPLTDTMPKADFDALIAELFKGYAP
jgi:tetratricopeptide (TPR) repeat protein